MFYAAWQAHNVLTPYTYAIWWIIGCLIGVSIYLLINRGWL
jgi:uncharacterized membrane protein YozB (DUF420 family)